VPAPPNRARVTNVNTDEEDSGGTNLIHILAERQRVPACSRPDLTDRDSAADGDFPAAMNSSTQPAPSSLRQNQSGSNDAQYGSSKPNFTSRRRQSSIPKIPMGPRPLDCTAGKRYGAHSLHPRDPLTDPPSLDR
jgi:hypothetical protein